MLDNDSTRTIRLQRAVSSGNDPSTFNVPLPHSGMLSLVPLFLPLRPSPNAFLAILNRLYRRVRTLLITRRDMAWTHPVPSQCGMHVGTVCTHTKLVRHNFSCLSCLSCILLLMAVLSLLHPRCSCVWSTSGNGLVCLATSRLQQQDR